MRGLKTRFGNLGNILDFDTLTKENIYVWNSPILSNSQFNKFINFFGKNSVNIDCTFFRMIVLQMLLKKNPKRKQKFQSGKVYLNLFLVIKIFLLTNYQCQCCYV